MDQSLSKTVIDHDASFHKKFRCVQDKLKAKEHWTFGAWNVWLFPGETWRSQTFALRSQLEEQSGQSGCS